MVMDTTQLHHLKRQQATESGSGTNFYIADTSPFLSYADPSSSSSLWTSGYALQSDGYDQTLHMTSRSNAQISFNISATLLTFLVPSYPNCKATVAINGSSPIDACAEASSSGDVPFSLYNLPTGTHQVTWQAGQLSSTDRVIFWGIDGMREPEPSASTNVTIDDTYTKNGIVDLEWDGAWDLLQPGQAKEGWSETGYLDASFNKTLHVTQKQDAAFRFSGEGTALYLYGMIGPDHGSASVEVDGQIVAPHLNLTSAWLLPYQLLWFTTGMAAGSHDVTLKNLEDKKMALDFVILTTSDSNLSELGGSSPEFLSTLAGKLVIFLVIPSIACLLIGLAAFCYITRRRDKRRRASRDSSLSLRPNLGFITAPRPGLEKRDSEWSAHASPFGGEMFVAYDLRDSQSNPDRWSNPISPTSHRSMSSGETPYGGSSTPGQRTMSALPESFTDSPMQRSPNTDASGNTWTRPIRSLLGSSYTRSSRAPSRRQTNLTNLPPYTPGDNGTYLPDNEENRDAPQAYPTAIQEKEAQLEHLRRINAHTSNGASSSTSPRGLTAASVVVPAERPRPPSTAAPSEIMSVYGQPPSERRDSAMTSSSAPGLPYIYRQQHISSLPTRSEVDEDLGQSPIPSRSPNSRPTPTVDTSFLDRNGPSRPSATSSIAANSAMPLLDSPQRTHVWNSPFQDTSRSGSLTHKRSMTAMSTRSAHSEAQSAARPDSDIIPFDTFLSQGPPSSWRP